MRLRPRNTKDFLVWYVERLCKHPADRCLLSNETVICQNCNARMTVNETSFKQYADQYVRLADKDGE